MSSITGLLSDLDQKPTAAARALGDLPDDKRAQFIERAIVALSENPDSAATAPLLRLLVGDPLLLDRITDPKRLSEKQSVEVARRLQAVDASTDVRLLRLLLDGGGTGRMIDPEHASRILEVAGQLSDGRRILSLLTSLVRHPHPAVRSKAALLTGRTNRNARWVEMRLTDPDPRVRANAVESIWGVRCPECRAVLQAASHDPDHRVAANASVGLYHLGDLIAVRLMRAMLSHQESRFRSAFSWAMGETNDPRFLKTLAESVCRETGPVRLNALRAMARVRERLSKLQSKPTLRVQAERKGTAIRVEVHSASGAPLDRLPPTAFVVTWENNSVEIVSVEYERTQPSPYYVVNLENAVRDGIEVTVYSDEGKGGRTISSSTRVP